MAYGVIIPRKIAAQDVQSYNRSAVAATDYEQGSVGYFSAKSTTSGESEVWTITAPVTGNLSNLWMMNEPEIMLTNEQYKGLDPDPRNFLKHDGEIFSVFMPQIGDLITMSADAVTGTKSTNTFVVATNAAQQLTWAASAVSGLSLKLIETDYISIGLGSIGTQRITSYLFEVQAVA
jgi:hypothetical protein